MFLFHIRDIRVIRRRMRCLLFFSDSFAQAFSAGLQSYSHLVVSDSGAARDAVRVTYLGTKRLPIRIQRSRPGVDLYFSRVNPLSVALGSRIQPNASRINDRLRYLASGNCRTDAILVAQTRSCSRNCRRRKSAGSRGA